MLNIYIQDTGMSMSMTSRADSAKAGEKIAFAAIVGNFFSVCLNF
jgi:hypothetical protein